MGTHIAKSWTVMAQSIDDPASGLSVHFEVAADGSSILRLISDTLPHRNREFLFDTEGRHIASGTDATFPDS